MVIAYARAKIAHNGVPDGLAAEARNVLSCAAQRIVEVRTPAKPAVVKASIGPPGSIRKLGVEYSDGQRDFWHLPSDRAESLYDLIGSALNRVDNLVKAAAKGAKAPATDGD